MTRTAERAADSTGAGVPGREEARAAAIPRRILFAIAALLLAAHAALAVHSLWRKSTAFDEASHLPAGLALAATGEAWLNPQHPPLVKLLAGWAASTLEPRLPLEDEPYRDRREWDFGHQVLYELGNDAMALLRRGRLPVVALSVLGGLVTFLWSRRRYGDPAGLASLTLYAFSPTVLAHARFVTMDAAVSAGAVLTLYLWWRATARAPRFDLEAACGLGLGIALAAKFSGLILLPAMALAELAANGPRRSWGRRLRAWAVVLGVAALVVELAYLWPDDLLRYVKDVRLVYADTRPDYPYYLAGEFRVGGFPHYFLAALALKSTLPGLAAMLGGLSLAALRRRAWRDDLYLWLPAAVWLAVTSYAAANQGVRYVLPLYPLLFVLAGGLVPLAWERRHRGIRWLLVLLLAAHVSEAARTHPDYVPYFHQLAGGVRGGPRWLAKSDLDWGQDLYRLPGWLAERGVERIRLLYLGTGVPEYFGVVYEPVTDGDWRFAPRAGAYVISAECLVRGLHQAETRGWKSDWLRRYEPVDVLGGSLYLYFFAPSTDAVGASGR